MLFVFRYICVFLLCCDIQNTIEFQAVLTHCKISCHMPIKSIFRILTCLFYNGQTIICVCPVKKVLNLKKFKHLNFIYCVLSTVFIWFFTHPAKCNIISRMCSAWWIFVILSVILLPRILEHPFHFQRSCLTASNRDNISLECEHSL